MEQLPPTIELAGARLRPLRLQDAASWHAYLSDPRVTELTSYPEMSLAAVESMIESRMVGNVRSERVLERAHFTREGRLRSYRLCRGQPRDFSVFSILRPEWEAAGENRTRADLGHHTKFRSGTGMASLKGVCVAALRAGGPATAFRPLNTERGKKWNRR